MTSTPPPRVRVTSSRRTSRPPRRRTIGEEIGAQSPLGDTFVNSLRRAQLGLSLGLLVLVGLTLGALPLLFALLPPARTVTVLGLPLPWLVLAVLLYPLAVLVAWRFTRASERIEQEFTDIASQR